MSGGAGTGKPGGADTKANAKSPDHEIIEGFSGIFRVMSKMVKAAEKIGKPELKEKFAPVEEMLKSALVDVFKVDPNKVMAPEEAPPGAVQGNQSPQGVPDSTPPPPDQAQPTAA
jgi:hypothetical protein